MMKIILLAASSGATAYAFPFYNRTPKHLYHLNGEILLKRLINQILTAGFEQKDIEIVTGFGHQKIVDFLVENNLSHIKTKRNTHWKKSASYTLSKAIEGIDENFMLFCADDILTNDFFKFIKNNSDGIIIHNATALMLQKQHIDSVQEIIQKNSQKKHIESKHYKQLGYQTAQSGLGLSFMFSEISDLIKEKFAPKKIIVPYKDIPNYYIGDLDSFNETDEYKKASFFVKVLFFTCRKIVGKMLKKIRFKEIKRKLMKCFLIPFVFCFFACKQNSTLIPTTGSKTTNALLAGWGKGSSWQQQNEFINAMCVKNDTVDILMIGNSITQSWGSRERGGMHAVATKIQEAYFKGRTIVNAGISGDRVEHILWRLKNGKMQQTVPKYIMLAVGVNNFKYNTAEEIAAGIMNLVRVIKKDFTASKLILFGLLPTGKKANSPKREKYRTIQKILTTQIKAHTDVIYHNPTKDFTLVNGDLNPDFYSNDAVHLIADGYKKWAEIIVNLTETNHH